MLFRHISIKKQKLTLVYSDSNEMGTNDIISMKCDDEPAPSFREALDKLAPDLVKLCELPKDDAVKVNMLGVSFSYHGDSNQQAVIMTGYKKLINSSGVMVMNSPLRFEREDKPNSKKDISETLREKLDDLQLEALKYLKGYRQTIKLKLGDEPNHKLKLNTGAAKKPGAGKPADKKPAADQGAQGSPVDKGNQAQKPGAKK